MHIGCLVSSARLCSPCSRCRSPPCLHPGAIKIAPRTAAVWGTATMTRAPATVRPDTGDPTALRHAHGRAGAWARINATRTGLNIRNGRTADVQVCMATWDVDGACDGLIADMHNDALPSLARQPAGVCDTDIAMCYCPPETRYGHVAAPKGSPLGTPPVKVGRPLYWCQPSSVSVQPRAFMLMSLLIIHSPS